MKVLISAIAICFLFYSCNSGDQNQAKEDTSSTSEPSVNTKASEANSIEGIMDSYLKLKNALADDNGKGAANAGNEVVNALKGFDKFRENAGRSQELSEITENAVEHAEHIGANAGNIEHQREHFESLSQDIYDLVKITGSGKKLYYTHCPMYNDNKGANWLSETKEIRNPYLGKEMLECGTVKEELN
jgi:hypothetical protein